MGKVAHINTFGGTSMRVTSIPLASFAVFVDRIYSTSSTGRSTRQKVEQMLTELSQIAGPGATTESLTTSMVLDWRDEFGANRSDYTVIAQLDVIRKLCSIAQEEGWIERAPAFRRIKPRVRRQARKRHFAAAEIRRLLVWCASHLDTWEDRRRYAAVATAAYTGLRRSELLCLPLEHLDLARGVLMVAPRPGDSLKTDRSIRLVPIAPELHPILQGWLPEVGPHWVFPGVRRRGPWRNAKHGCRPVDELRRVCREAGVPEGTWQWFRRAWTTHAETLWEFSDAAIERLAGHSEEVSKRWYRAADVDNIRALGERITFGLGS